MLVINVFLNEQKAKSTPLLIIISQHKKAVKFLHIEVAKTKEKKRQF